MRQRFYICIPQGIFKECPSARRVVIPGYEQYTFFAHRALIEGDVWQDKYWRITEATTGQLCGGNSSNTIKQCIERTKQILDRVGKEALEQCINGAAKSPYTKQEHKVELP